MLEYKALHINDDEKLCYLKDEPVVLTKIEYNILCYLLNNKNKIHHRKTLIKEIWNSNVNDRAVDSAISRLRKKIKPYDKYIVSRIGFGYGFMENI